MHVVRKRKSAAPGRSLVRPVSSCSTHARRVIGTSRLEHTNHGNADREDDEGDATDDEPAAAIVPAKRPRSESLSRLPVAPLLPLPVVSADLTVDGPSTTILDFFGSLSPLPALAALAPILIAGGMPDRAETLLELDEADLVAFLDELGPEVTKVARIVLLSRLRAEWARRSALSL